MDEKTENELKLQLDQVISLFHALQKELGDGIHELPETDLAITFSESWTYLKNKDGAVVISITIEDEVYGVANEILTAYNQQKILQPGRYYIYDIISKYVPQFKAFNRGAKKLLADCQKKAKRLENHWSEKGFNLEELLKNLKEQMLLLRLVCEPKRSVELDLSTWVLKEQS